MRRIITLWVMLGLVACLEGQQRPRHPNVLFLAVDDLRPELGCYGAGHAHTPHIDRLAASGMLFRNAYCPSAVCNPSRASVMTGKRPDTTRVHDLRTDLRKVSPDIVTLPQHLRGAGYVTASVGKIYHNVFPDEPSWTERHYVEGFPFDPDAVYLGEEGKAGQAERLELLRTRGRAERALDRFGHYYLKAQATEAPDCEDDAYYDGAQTTWAISKLEELAAQEAPFFLAVGYYRPHLPFNAPKRYWDLYDRATLPLSETPEPPVDAPTMALNNLRELRGYTDFHHLKDPRHAAFTEDERRLLKHGYLASVSYVDAQIGRLLDTLERLERARDTIVVLWSDHGWKLGDYNSYGKMTNFEVDTRVPLIVRAPGVAQAGTTCERLVELVDLFPTLASLCDVETPEDLEGSSFVALLQEPDRPWKRAVFTQYLREGNWVGPEGHESIGRAIRTATHRYVEWTHRETNALVGRELYDLVHDPRETRNVVDDAGNAAIAQELHDRLQAGWRAERM